MQIIFDISKVQGNIITGSYDGLLIALSLLIATAASYVAIHLIIHFRSKTETQARKILLLASACSLGGGIWAMHFIGMLAFSLPSGISHGGLLTIISLLLALTISGLGIYWICGKKHSVAQLIIGGIIVGIGLCVMHLTDMASIQMSGKMYYRFDLLLLSIIIGIITATTTLWSGLRLSNEHNRTAGIMKLIASLVAGLGFSAMHYSGMAAAIFVATDKDVTTSVFVLDTHLMAIGISLMIAIIFFMSILATGTNERVTGRRRIGLLTLLMSMISFAVAGIGLTVLYDAAFNEEQEWLSETVQIQARLIEAVAQFNLQQNSDAIAFATTLAQVRNAHASFRGFGDTGEFTLGIRKGDNIYFLLRHRHEELTKSSPVPYSLEFAEPMRRALAGKSGTMIGLDYRGERVLAAYEPLAVFDMGVVTKLDLTEIRAPFLRASMLAGIGMLILVTIGIALSRGIGIPLIQQLEEKDRLELELEIARSIQEGLLPDSPPHHVNFEFAAKTIPARFVGGDFYDFINIEGNRLGIVIGDVSGKGVSAALYMSRLMSDYRNACKHNPNPSSVNASINNVLCKNATQGMFATAIYILLDLNKKKMQVSNAGHPLLTIRSDSKKTSSIGLAGGPALGVEADKEYMTEEIELTTGQSILIFTDGITEPRNAEKEHFGIERVNDFFSVYEGSPAELIDELYKEICNFTGNAPQHDDLTLVTFNVL